MAVKHVVLLQFLADVTIQAPNQPVIMQYYAITISGLHVSLVTNIHLKCGNIECDRNFPAGAGNHDGHQHNHRHCFPFKTFRLMIGCDRVAFDIETYIIAQSWYTSALFYGRQYGEYPQ